jgi:STE24 endopeptidase
MAEGSGAFDPAAATAAYLARLAPEVHARATAYTHGEHWLLLWSTLVSVGIAWVILRTGLLVRIRRRIAATRRRPWLAVAATAATALAMESLLELPWEAYAEWWRERAYGLTSRPFLGWLTEELAKSLIYGLVMVVFLLGLYALIRRAPKRWWLWGGALTGGVYLFLLVAAPIFIEPLFNRFTPAPPGPVRDAVVALAKAGGVPSDKIVIFDGSKQSNRYTAHVSGAFGSARIVMSDVMFKKGADMAEIRGVVGHEMGHYAHAHTLWFALAYGVSALVAFFLVDRLFPAVARLAGAEGVQGIADPAGLPVIAIILAVLGLLSTPLTSSVTRFAESDADQFSLEVAGEPDGLAKALVKTIEYRAATPSPVEEFIFYDHPSVGARIRRCMDWKATHPPGGAPGPAGG